MSLLSELRRRNVFRVGIAYVIWSWVLIQVASIVLPTFDAPPWIMQGVVVLSVVGFPVVLILAWVYELTPEGVKRSDEIPASESITRWTGRKLDFIIIGLLCFALAVVVIDNYVLEREEPVTARNKSIAVLPFENRSAEEENAAFFADGLHDDLLTMLSKIGDLRVISRTSVERFRDTDQTVAEIAEVLGVSTVLEGGVQRAGNRVRINVQLIDATTDKHLWAETFDRELTVADVFDIQAQTAQAIATALQAHLTPQEQQRLTAVPTDNLAAYEAYLLGRHRMAQLSSAGLAAAGEYFQQALDLDPTFSQAYVGLADSLILQVQSQDLAPQPALGRATALIEKALKLNPALAEAYSSLGDLRYAQFQPKDAEAAFIRALELNPGYAWAYASYGVMLVELGRHANAQDQLKKGLQLDPLSADMHDTLGVVLEGLGQTDAALAQYEKAIEIDPTFPLAYWHIGDMYLFSYGRLDEAVVWHGKSLSIDPGDVSRSAGYALDYLDLGDGNRAEYWIRSSLTMNPQTHSANNAMAMLQLFRGEYAKAVEYATIAHNISPQNWWGAFQILRDDDLRAGRYAEARARYTRNFPALLSTPDPDIHLQNVSPAIGLALVLLKTGERERADFLLDASLEFIRTIPRLSITGYWIADVQIHALRGETQAALAALRQAIDQGWRVDWLYYLEHDLSLESLWGEPEFQAMLAEIKADMAAQLERVREMERNGELEPIPEVVTAQ